MQKKMEEYLNELKERRNKQRRARIIMALLVVLVAGSVTAVLSRYGITMTGNETCGMEEHVHSEECGSEVPSCGQDEGESHVHTIDCYMRSDTPLCGIEETEGHQHGAGCYETESTLACGLEESEEHQHSDDCYTSEQVLACGLEETEGHQHSDSCYIDEQTVVCGKEEGSAHHHSDACYEQQFTCGMEEHTHTDDCYIDHEADVEDISQWDAAYANTEWKDNWNEDLVIAAEKQIGYRESQANYQIAEDGSHKGYTRYGAFAYEPYCDWDAVFVNFCIHYAGKDDNNIEASLMFPQETVAAKWYEEFLKADESNRDFLAEPEEYVPMAGDLVFFEKENEENALLMGIVSDYDEIKNEIKVIEGNSENEVRENTYGIEETELEENHIFAYLKMAEVEAAYKASLELVEEPEPVEEEEPEEILELSTEVDGTTIILSGPESSFEEGKEYSIQAEKVEDEEIIATIEEALTELEVPVTDSGGTVEPADEVGTADDGTASDDEVGLVDDEASVVNDQTASDDEVDAVNDETTSEGEPDAANSGAPLEDGEDAADGETPVSDEENQELVKQVKSYQAFDIKLIADGEEVQPLGPVNVKFSSPEVAESVEDAKTDVTVLHVDESTGEATDMEAVATEEKDVVIETDHFSVYVYVTLDNIFGKINVTVQHWGEGISVINGTAEATGKDEAFQTGNNPHVKTTDDEECEIYSTDTFIIPNEYYANVEELSKLCNTNKMNYTLSKVWVCNDKDKIEEYTRLVKDTEKGTEKVKDTWDEGTYTEYKVNEEEPIKLQKDSLIRFWYKPNKTENQLPTPANFYDYDITDGTVTKYGSVKTKGTFKLRSTPVDGTDRGTPAACWSPILEEPQKQSDGYYWYKINCNGKVGYMRSDGLTVEKTYADQDYVKSEEKGINASGNFTSESTTNRMGVGQQSSGNLSSWATTAVGDNGKYLNRFNSGQNAVVKGIVGNTLVDGNLQYNATVPKDGFFAPGLGVTAYSNKYQLRFKQDGDTYTLQNVYNKVSRENVTGDLTQFHMYDRFNSEYPSGLPSSGVWSTPVYSNDFWPMDDVTGADPHMGTSLKQYRFLYNNDSELQKADGPNPSDDNVAHNWHFGMTYAVDFKVGDYTGPMEYYFRGDDDFWLFIDDKLAVDIGGIHSSAGETLDVRKWLEENGMLADKNEMHTMKIFYMERGGFGSCCYMQFTLPNAEPVTLSIPETTEYTVTKKWEDNNNPFRPESITVQLKQIDRSEDNRVTNAGEAVKLNEGNNWTYHWEGLPKSKGITNGVYLYAYKVEEVSLPLGYTWKYEKGVLTNTLTPVKVEVEKNWENDSGIEEYRPDSITLRLFANGKEYKDKKGQYRQITLNADNGWKGEFINLPEYYYSNPETTESEETVEDTEQNEVKQGDSQIVAEKIQYSVREVVNGKVIGENETIAGKEGALYEVHYPSEDFGQSNDEQENGAQDEEQLDDVQEGEEQPDDVREGEEQPDDVREGEEQPDDVQESEQRCVATLTVTNKLRTTFQIVKKGNVKDKLSAEEAPLVPGATFSLTPCTDTGEFKEDTTLESYIGTSDNTGIIMWQKDIFSKKTSSVPAGTYLLEETSAPQGYMLSTEKWILKVDDTGRATAKIKGGTTEKDVTPSTEVSEDGTGTVVFSFTFYDEALYELPSTGGLGIHRYMFGGVLLMLAAALITYKNKCKEVQGS